MKRIVTAAVVCALFWPAISEAQEVRERGSGRPTGFMLEVDVAAQTSLWAWEFELPISTFVPKLTLGAQIRRFAIGLQTSMSVVAAGDDDDFEAGYWLLRFGPHVDGEIWTSGRASLFLFGSVLVSIAGEETDADAKGFVLDFGLGGRIYMARQFSVGIAIGSTIDVVFYDGSGDFRTLVWGLYGALTFRFTAGN